MPSVPPEHWLKPTQAGLYCEPGKFHIDPAEPVARAIITHGHADHARAGHDHVLATPETAAIMAVRYGRDHSPRPEPIAYRTPIRIGDVTVTLLPAGHILGSAQVVMEFGGTRAIVSGDFKRRRDPTCEAFEPMQCDLFVTEATFGLPVFRHPDDAHEIKRLLDSVALYPERAHLVGVYPLGKCQRFMCLLRESGYTQPIYLHGGLQALTDLYVSLGVEVGASAPITDLTKDQLKGALVLCPPSAISDRWSRRLPDPIRGVASGWMQVRARARQQGAELPLTISDHADWDELLQTVEDVQAGEVWVTHGREEGLVHALLARGRKARALSLAGRDEDEGEA
jgi:putative mRNA 3-end processing factor